MKRTATMTPKATSSLAFLTLALGLVASAVAGDIYVLPCVDEPLPAWREGELDIHFINSGRGGVRVPHPARRDDARR